MVKLLYKPVGLLFGVLGGMLAGAIFKKIWKLAAGEDETPKATDAHRGWPEVLAAAALQGALFAVVKAAADRTAATGTHKLTGTWPGDEGPAGDGRGGYEPGCEGPGGEEPGCEGPGGEVHGDRGK